MNFGESLKLLRKKNGVSKSALHEWTGVNKSTILNIERGTQNPSIATAQLLLEPFGLELTIREKNSES